jgi:hypothetical protein
MQKFLGLFYLLVMFGLLLTACGSSPPPLAVANEPTVVYVYTDG